MANRDCTDLNSDKVVCYYLSALYLGLFRLCATGTTDPNNLMISLHSNVCSVVCMISVFTTLRFLLYLLVLLYVLFWFLVDHTVHFHYCITLPIIWTYCCKNTVNCYYCTALPILGTVLKSKACNIYKNWSYNGTYWYQGHFKGLTKKTLTLKKEKL